MAALSRLEAEFEKLRGRRKRRRPWLAVLALLVLAGGVAGVVERERVGAIWFGDVHSRAAAASGAPGTAAIVASSSAAPAVSAASAPRELKLWSPQKVDANTVPILFEYETDAAEPVKAQLLVKKMGEPEYRPASLHSDGTIAAKPGEHMYSLQWDKAKDGVAPGQTFDLRLALAAPDGAALQDDVRSVRMDSRENVRNKAESYVINYGAWSDDQLDEARTHAELVVLDTKNVTPEQVQTLRAGKDPHDASDDVLVLGYVSVGEDKRTIGYKDKPEAMKLDPRFTLDGSGPSVDPRPGAPFPNIRTQPADLNVEGKPTNGGYAPFYLNDDYAADHVGAKDVPEFNGNFGGAFVNPGHPEWQKALSDMTLANDKESGLKEVLTPDYGAGFACDGLFLDTLDTAAPNSYTDASSPNVTEYEWTAKGTQQLLQNIRKMYPDKLLLGNRGLFFYNPDLPSFAFTLRGTVDFVLYESFRLDSNSDQWYNESFFNDNKYKCSGMSLIPRRGRFRMCCMRSKGRRSISRSRSRRRHKHSS
jgi:hypothetical protein